jgi:hypothetical protein
MAASDCIDTVAAAGGGLSRSDAQGILDLVDERAERLMRDRGLDASDAHIQAARELGDDEAFRAAIERRKVVANLRARVIRRA